MLKWSNLEDVGDKYSLTGFIIIYTYSDKKGLRMKYDKDRIIYIPKFPSGINQVSIQFELLFCEKTEIIVLPL